MRRLHRGSIVDRAARRVPICDVLDWLGIPNPGTPPEGVSIKCLCPFQDTHPQERSGEKDMRIYSDGKGFCFTGDTTFITREGVKTLKECVGTTQYVLTPDHQFNGWGPRTESTRFDGVWQEAPISSFGVSRVLRVTLRRNKLTKVIRATPNHRWVAAPRGRAFSVVETSGLRSGMSLASLSSQVRVDRSVPSPFGIAHGFVFGDGSLSDQGCRVDLWGEKDAALLPYFAGCPTRSIVSKGGVSATQIRGLPKYFKSRPSLDEGVSYLFGWLAGYIAADGSVSLDGKVFLESSVYENLDFARTIATRLGIPTYSITSSDRLGFGTVPTPMYRLHFLVPRVPASLLIIPEHRRRFEQSTMTGNRLRWTVVSVEDLGEEEEVFCATVPRTALFTLEDNILVGNCHLCAQQWDSVRLASQIWSLTLPEAARMVLARSGLELSEDEELSALLAKPTPQQLRPGALAALAVWADARAIDRFGSGYGRCLELADQITEPHHVDAWLSACKKFLEAQSHA
jgi:DNA primase